MATSVHPRREAARNAMIAGGVQVSSYGPHQSEEQDKVAQDLSPAQSSLMSYIDVEAQRCREYLYPFHKQWYENISAALGAQSQHAYNVAKALRVNAKRPPHRVKHLTNIIAGKCRRLIGHLSRSNPDIEIHAGDLHDPFQVDMAQGAKRWSDHHELVDDWERKRLDVLDWMVYTAFGLTRADWDANAGPRMAAVDDQTGQPLLDPETGEPLVDRHGNPILFSTGMPLTTVVPPFHWIYNINARNYDELVMAGESSWLGMNVLERMRPGIVKELGLNPENQYQDSTGYYERQVTQTIGPSGIYTGLAPENEVHGLKVNQVYIAPYFLDPDLFHGAEDPLTGEKYDGQEFYEKGAFAITAQNMLISMHPNVLLDLEGTLPLQDWHPYTIWPCYTIPGRFMPQGVPDNLHPLQDGMNFQISRIRESAKLMGQPKWFVPKNGISKGELNSEAGEKIYFNSAVGPPMAWAPPPLPAYVFSLIELFEQHADKVSSQPPMLRGEAQGQVRSGYGVALLQEQGLSEFTPMIGQLSWARARHKRQLLLRQIQSGELPVRVPYRTRSGDWEQTMFFSQHMSPDFHLRIRAGTEMPHSKAAVMAELDRGIAWGAIQPQMNPKHNELIARSMGWDLPVIFDGNEEDNLRSARYENWVLAEGGVVITHPVFNHTVHVNEHIRFMTSQRYREMAEKDPELNHRMYRHLSKHFGYLQQIQAGIVVPQPISPIEDMAAVLPPEQLQQLGGQAGGGGGGGGQAGGGGGGGPTNQGPVSTGTGTQLGMARGGGANQGGRRGVQSLESVGSPPSVESM